jgi:hypothetical protein
MEIAQILRKIWTFLGPKYVWMVEWHLREFEGFHDDANIPQKSGE